MLPRAGNESEGSELDVPLSAILLVINLSSTPNAIKLTSEDLEENRGNSWIEIWIANITYWMCEME
jgi:hypothetical protein